MTTDQDLLKGEISLKSGQTLTIKMHSVHWKGLRWLTEHHEGDVVSEIEELLRDPNRTDETNSQIVTWYVQLFLDHIFDSDSDT